MKAGLRTRAPPSVAQSQPKSRGHRLLGRFGDSPGLLGGRCVWEVPYARGALIKLLTVWVWSSYDTRALRCGKSSDMAPRQAAFTSQDTSDSATSILQKVCEERLGTSPATLN